MDKLATVTPDLYADAYGQIARAADAYALLRADSPEGYEEVRLAIADCRTTRAAIEVRRKELKSDALEYGRAVDSVAKDLFGRVEAIEAPLKAKKAEVDDAKEAIRRAKDDAKRAIVEAQIRAEREAEETRLRTERAAEQARIQAEWEAQSAERERLAKERAELEAAQAVERAARARLEAEQAELVRIQREQLARLAQEAQVREAAERVARDATLEAERQAALAPVSTRLSAYAGRIRAVVATAPEVGHPGGKALIGRAGATLEAMAGLLEGFGSGA